MLFSHDFPLDKSVQQPQQQYRSELSNGSLIRQQQQQQQALISASSHIPLVNTSQITSYPLMSAIHQPALYSPTSYSSAPSNPIAMVPSPPTSCPSSINLRYDIALEGQYYTIHLKDTEAFDGDISSTVAIMFHDESHRKSASNYWRFWLGQQHDPSARAIDIGNDLSPFSCPLTQELPKLS
ncbi:hypothetical protein DFQ30_005052 [Apophysomyces sp. BC1015]|nr:hypothetical protein DFQ30_005052 [Apophysomyces sp. BC1015]